MKIIRSTKCSTKFTTNKKRQNFNKGCRRGGKHGMNLQDLGFKTKNYEEWLILLIMLIIIDLRPV